MKMTNVWGSRNEHRRGRKGTTAFMPCRHSCQWVKRRFGVERAGVVTRSLNHVCSLSLLGSHTHTHSLSPLNPTPPTQDALSDRDLVHRQTAATVVQHLALGVAGLSCEDALT
jgi:hypothetical protein